MEPDDTVALYERILSLLKPRELHCSSNYALQHDYTGLKSSVDSVVATFAKVEEVRDAVNQLEQGKASNGRSASLMDELDRTMQLQKELGDKLKKMADVIFTKEEEKREKRKRKEKKTVKKENEEESVSFEESTLSLSINNEEEKEIKCKKQKREASDKNEKKQEKVKKNGSADEKKQSDDLSIAHEALAEILKVNTVNKRMQFESKNTWAIALFDIKRVLKHQSSCNAHTTDNSAAEVAARALEAAAAVFQNLEWTAEHTKEAQSVIAALTDACSKNKTLRIIFHRARAQLESLEMSIPAFPAQSSVNTKTTSAGSSLEHQLRTYYDLVNNMHTLPPGAKVKRILKALIAIQQVMAGDVLGEHQIDVRRSISDVSRWIGETPIQNDLSKEYARFANGITAYSKNIPGKSKQMDWQRLSTSVLTLLDEKTNSSQPAKTVHLHLEFSTTTKKMQGRLASIMDQVEQWQDGIFSLDQVDKVFKTLNEVVSYKSTEWNPYSGHTMRDCLEKLTTCIKMITKKGHRDKRLKTLSRWTAACNKLR